MRRLTRSLVASAVVLGATALGITPASAAPGDQLPEWSGTVLGGTEITLPAKDRTIEFESIHPGSNFTLGIDTEGNAWSWGINGFGQLGNSEYLGRFIFAPYPVPMLDVNGKQLRAKDLAADGNFSIALDSAGAAWTYGRNNFAQLGNTSVPGNVAGTVTPVPVLNAAGDQMSFAKVSTGINFGFGLEADGSAWAWGRNYYGQLGGISNSYVFATPVSTVATPVLNAAGDQMKFSEVIGGEDFSFGLDPDGFAWAWGSNSNGQLGLPAGDSPRARPLLDTNGDQARYVQISAGYNSAIARDSEGRVWGWGNNRAGVLGTAVTGATSVPAPILGADGSQLVMKWVDHAASSAFGVDATGQVWAWGNNAYGQLGQDPATLGDSSAVPVRVERSPGVPLIADRVYSGDSHATAIGDFHDETRTNAWAWGASWYGQLGNPGVDTSADAMSPTPVPITLAQPSTNSIVYFGDDDTVGVRGTVVDGKLVVKAPRHISGRVPVYVSWFGDQPSTDLVGYFTFMLDPTIQMDPAKTDVDKQALAIVELPEAEIPLVGEAAMQFTLGQGLSVTAGDIADPVRFDAEGRVTLPVTSKTGGEYAVEAKAFVDQRNDTPAGDGPIVAVSGKLTTAVTFVGPKVPPTKTPTQTPVVTEKAPTSPAPPATGLANTGANLTPLLVTGIAVAVSGALLALRRRRVARG
ncbi:hypothetical protein G7068_05080 [Leucobacter viscericola]|uniref:Gram-positive cocci surface proteins LPxTG domain-containing protein n=1 Tax=Leucobacter viscericola TaxID=2714935 RepID=A0A6G7XE58_9MICO|nr:hypothetical protein [Leucobacter viscericola]QIK62651.1 hypothetical protein G7068_05080 [Leucobacter viscericola]